MHQKVRAEASGALWPVWAADTKGAVVRPEMSKRQSWTSGPVTPGPGPSREAPGPQAGRRREGAQHVS
jgi:hypothetical protein